MVSKGVGTMTYRRSLGSALFDLGLVIFLTLLSVVFIYPLLLMFSLSVSDPNLVGYAPPKIIPTGFVLEAYKFLLTGSNLLRYYANTILYVSVGTFIMLLFTSLLAYTLTYKWFSANKLFTVMLVIPMFFSGGLVPFYLIVRGLGLMNTMWALVLPGSVAGWNVIIFRTFFNSIPVSLKEAAFMDGARHPGVLFKIILPLSKPLLATFTLFTTVGIWNSWFYPTIFLRDWWKQPIQVLLRRLAVDLDPDFVRNAPLEAQELMNSRQVKAAALMLTIAPILCMYPFLQKYFAKGILIGSIKS